MDGRGTGCGTDGGAKLPHFSDEINRNVIRSELEGGVFLERLRKDAALEVQTQNRCYRIVVQGQGRALISGHPRFCPEPVLVRIHGSSWGGSMLKLDFIGRGMFLEFEHPVHRTVTTSRIIEIRELPGSAERSSN